MQERIPGSGLFQSAAVSAYTTYLTVSAVVGNPYQCVVKWGKGFRNVPNIFLFLPPLIARHIQSRRYSPNYPSHWIIHYSRLHYVQCRLCRIQQGNHIWGY